MAVGYNPRIVTDGLVLCLDSANTKSYGGSGTTWTDVSGSGNNGTLYNGPTHTSGADGYFTFDGSNDYSQLSDTLAPSTGSFSGFFWYQITGTSGRGGLFERRQGSPYNGWSLGQGGTSN